MKFERRKILFCEWSLPPYHFPQHTEDEIGRRKNIFITKEENKFLITSQVPGSVVDLETQDDGLSQL